MTQSENMREFDDWNWTDAYGNNEYPDEPYRDAPRETQEFHSVFTITLGELMEEGVVDFRDGSWDKTMTGGAIEWFDDEQRMRFWDTFANRYYWREIGEEPIRRWKWDVLSKAQSVMPKYSKMYELLASGMDVAQVADKYGKSRSVFSDFPQTQLGGNQDYASNGSDREYENVEQGSFTDVMKFLHNDFEGVDMWLVDEFRTSFYCVLSSNMNSL